MAAGAASLAHKQIGDCSKKQEPCAHARNADSLKANSIQFDPLDELGVLLGEDLDQLRGGLHLFVKILHTAFQSLYLRSEDFGFRWSLTGYWTGGFLS